MEKPFRFLAIGECMVEMAPLENDGTYKMGFAGDTFNTCWYLKQIAGEMIVDFCSRVGNDATSDQMMAMMAKAGVGTTFVQRCDQRTVGLYLIALQDGERSFSYWRSQSAARLLGQNPSLLIDAMSGADMVYVSGITLGILDQAGRDVLFAALAAARSSGTRIAFDSNLRPRLWRDEKDMCDAVMTAARHSDIVLPSFDDEAVFFGDASPKATLDRYGDAGAACVVVKDGADSVHYLDQKQYGAVAIPKVQQIVDTTSAGDSFNAGIFAGLAAKSPMEDAILLGAKVAGAVIGQRGALVDLPEGF